jgi:uncharacterized protein
LTLKSEQVRALVCYRLDQALETLREADILHEQSAWRGTVNRAYYAMFYALLALLVARQLRTSKHSGALSLFDREFVKTGLFPRKLSRSIRLAFGRRQSYDYGEIIETDEESATETLDNAREFVAAVSDFLRSEEYLTR